jgi:hypothetical protein
MKNLICPLLQVTVIRFTIDKYSVMVYKFITFFIFIGVRHCLPVTVAERSKACTVFARSQAGIVGSNPSQGMDV